MKPHLNVRKQKGRWQWSCSRLGCAYGNTDTWAGALLLGGDHIIECRAKAVPLQRTGAES